MVLKMFLFSPLRWEMIQFESSWLYYSSNGLKHGWTRKPVMILQISSNPHFLPLPGSRLLQSQSGLTSQFKSQQDEIAKASRTGLGHPTQYGMVTSEQIGKVSNVVLFKDLVCMGVYLLILLPLSSHSSRSRSMSKRALKKPFGSEL